MSRIVEIRRFDHVVLLVAAQAVLRAECRGQVEVVECRERVECVLEARSDGRGVREQRDAPAGELPAQLGLGDEAVEAEAHHGWSRSMVSTKAVGS